jgi:predicted TIM-barrel fold metal-dependent hydrolase
MRCDAHVHIVGPADRYPQAPTRQYLADEAPIDRLWRQSAARGIKRFVLVQPSFYGADNTVMLESLDRLDGDGRGVAVVDPATTSSADLDQLVERHVCGLRHNLYSTPAARETKRLDQTFVALAELASDCGCHVEVIANLDVLVANADTLRSAEVPVVIDHYGLYGHARPESAEARTLLDLLQLRHVWIKLSAPYRVSDDPLATRPDPAWLAAILEVAAERCVWGSDWPHTPPHDQQLGAATPAPYRALSYEALVDNFLAALPSARLADQILIANPARLYGF